MLQLCLFTIVFTEVGELMEAGVITNRVSIISTRLVDELNTVLDMETNLASTRL